MLKGRVKWFNVDDGYGFITDENGVEIFVHYSQIIGNGYRMLHPEELVEYDLVLTSKGRQAHNVRRLGLVADGNGESNHEVENHPELSKSKLKSG